MKKIKESKGITLIALIITIIVLLILAVVAINAVQGDGIIAHAKNARDDYQVAQKEENEVLQKYLNDIEENIKKEDSDSIVGTYYVYHPEYYNTLTCILNEDGTIGGILPEVYNEESKNWKWEKKENDYIKITWEVHDVEWVDEEATLKIFNVGDGNVLAGDFGCILISSLDIINNFTYLEEGDYEGDFTISSTVVEGYKFGMWTNSDGTVPYFTDGDYVINSYGDIYRIDREKKLVGYSYYEES